MNSVQKIVKNIGVTGLAQIIISITAFFFMIYLARFLGEASFGRYNFAISLTSILVIITDLGVNQLIIREISQEKELSEKYTNNAFLLKIPFSILTLILIGIIIQLFNYQGELVWILYFFGAYHILLILSGTYLSLFKAYEKMEYVAVFELVDKLIIISIGFLFLYLGYGLLEISYVYLLAGLVSTFFIMYLSFKKLIKPRFEIDLKLQKLLIIKGLPFWASYLFTLLFFKIDSILLAFIIGDVSVGIYTAAYKPLLSLSMIVGGIVATAVYPVMSRQFKYSKSIIEVSTLFSSKYLAIIAFPIALGSIVLAEKFILMFYAGDFLESIIPFQILALFIPLRLISAVTGTVLSSINREGIRTFAFSLASIFNIGLNLILIPFFSYIGASIATVASELLLYFLFLFFINRYYGFINVNKILLKPFLGSLIMGGFVYLIRDENLFLVIVTGSLIYFASIFVLKTFDEEDKKLFKNIMARKK